jgi:anti-sigma regulatory factor (Ser/Thr protein kinase)
VTPAIDPQPERLVLRNELADLTLLSRWIEACTRQDASSDLAFAVALCLEEAVANIIMHSGGKRGQIEITVELAREGGAVTARVEDNGREFDPTQVPPLVPAASLQDAKVGDLGVHLIRSFASEMRYQRAGGRNQLTLRFLEPQAMSPG